MGSNSGQKVTIGGITFNRGLPPGARVINGTVTHHADGTETIDGTVTTADELPADGTETA